jgi:hypothetical protein
MTPLFGFLPNLGWDNWVVLIVIGFFLFWPRLREIGERLGGRGGPLAPF